MDETRDVELAEADAEALLSALIPYSFTAL